MAEREGGRETDRDRETDRETFLFGGEAGGGGGGRVAHAQTDGSTLTQRPQNPLIQKQ